MLKVKREINEWNSCWSELIKYKKENKWISGIQAFCFLYFHIDVP